MGVTFENHTNRMFSGPEGLLGAHQTPGGTPLEGNGQPHHQRLCLVSPGWPLLRDLGSVLAAEAPPPRHAHPLQNGSQWAGWRPGGPGPLWPAGGCPGEPAGDGDTTETETVAPQRL